MGILLCPVCGAELRLESGGAACPAGHRFDAARQGYLNLLTPDRRHARHPGDTRDMVAARRAFLDAGLYAPIAETAAALLAPYLPDAPALLDAGCGEGYYLTQLQKQYPGADAWGVDISKDAVRFAAGRNKDAHWIAATAAHLPFRDGSFDGVLSMFAMTAPGEFARVLRPDGVFLQVLAGRGHLLGLKRLIYPEILEKEAVLPDYAEFSELTQKTLEFEFTLTENVQIQNLLSMTPHFWRITKQGADAAAQAAMLTDRAQIVFRLLRPVDKRTGNH